LAAPDIRSGVSGPYAIPIIEPDIPDSLNRACEFTVWATWVLFGVDFVVREALAERRPRYLLRHWLDVLIIALPLLRPLRLLGLASLLKVLNRHATAGLRGQVAIYVAGGASLMAFCGALAVLDAERKNPSANITDFGDAILWAVTTMSTVGYGNRYPITGEGRLGAALLMVGGIALLGTVTATLASWLVEQVSRVEQREASDVRSEIAALNAKLDQLLAQHSELARSSPNGDTPESQSLGHRTTGL
jgi:voltage-gated potassium channel